MAKGNLISGSFWFLVSVFVGFESFRLGLGTMQHPGPGFLFFWTAIFLGILSLSLLTDAWRSLKTDPVGAGSPEKLNIGKVIFVLIGLFLYAFLLETLGFILLTFALLLFILGYLEKKGWVYSALVSLLITSASYLLFQTWLKTQLPLGILENVFF